MVDNSLYAKLDKSRIYRYDCFNNGIITELSIHEPLEYCNPCKNHGKKECSEVPIY